MMCDYSTMVLAAYVAGYAMELVVVSVPSSVTVLMLMGLFAYEEQGPIHNIQIREYNDFIRFRCTVQYILCIRLYSGFSSGRSLDRLATIVSMGGSYS